MWSSGRLTLRLSVLKSSDAPVITRWAGEAPRSVVGFPNRVVIDARAAPGAPFKTHTHTESGVLCGYGCLGVAGAVGP